MAEANWQQIRTIFDDALRRRPEERGSFVREACRGDARLLAEVESLLASLAGADNFLETPALARFADRISPPRYLTDGQSVGHYEIVNQIGAGGMGAVYLAWDGKLRRRVALKAVHDDFADERGKQRLLREARAAAKLDHRNICAIYEIFESGERSFIVMQYVEGASLAERLSQRRPAADEALALAVQIADALAEAHAHHIIHRDVKPANIIVSDKGEAKVLDFGLAKFLETDDAAERVRKLATSGAVVMGTIPFMSPEQLRGARLDARTDVFSCGALFYEMFAGRSAFARASDAETISAILNETPDLALAPRSLRPILDRCLEKEKSRRYASAGELAGDLRRLLTGGAPAELRRDDPFTAPAAAPSRTDDLHERPRRQTDSASSAAVENERPPSAGAAAGHRSATAWTSPAAVLFVLGALAAAFWAWQSGRQTAQPPAAAVRSVQLNSWKFALSSNFNEYRLSNDGRMLAFSSTQNGRSESIYVRQLAGGEDLPVTKDEWTNHSPLWSPDDQRLAYVSIREDQSGIYLCPSLGGPATALKVLERGNLTLRHWAGDGTAIFYEQNGNLWRLDLATGEIAALTNFPDAPGAKKYFALAPDERSFVYSDTVEGRSDLWLMPLGGAAAVRLTDDEDVEIRPRWHPDGRRVLYNVERDGDTQIYLVSREGGAPSQLTRGGGDYELIDASKDGARIVYSFWRQNSDLAAVDLRTGAESEIAAGTEAEFWSDASPDGRAIAFQINRRAHVTSTLYDSTIVVKFFTGEKPRLMFEGFSPRWLPDGRRLAFLRWSAQSQTIELRLADIVTGEETRLAEGVASPAYGLMPFNRAAHVFDWAAESNRFVYLDSSKRNVRAARLDTADAVDLTGNADPRRRYFPPHWSRDGERIAFLSVERPPERTEKPRWSVSTGEHGNIRELLSTTDDLRLLGWSPDGREVLAAMTDGVMKVYPMRIRIVAVSLDGKSRIAGTYENVYADSLTLSGDGRQLAFVARHDDKDDLWTAPARGGAASKRTGNASTRLFRQSGVVARRADDFFDKQAGVVTISMLENY